MKKTIGLVVAGVMICVAVLAAPFAALAQTADVVLLGEQLQTGTVAERTEAARALGLLATPDAAEALLARLAVEPDAAVGQAVATALGPLADRTMLPTLLAELQNDNPPVRWRAATVLGYLPDPSTLAALSYVIRNDDSIARSAAVNALIRIGTAEAASEVVPLLDTAELTAGRHAALAALEGIGDAAVEPLALALTSESVALRRNAAEALGWVASPRAVDALALALKDEDEGVRWQAASALDAIGTAEAQAALAASLAPAIFGTTTDTTNGVIIGGALVGLVALLGYFLLGGGRSRLAPRHR